MSKTVNHLLIITCFVIVSTLLVWLPHLLQIHNFWGLDFSNGFYTIYRNFDGLEYIVIAKTFYNPGLIAGIPQSLPASYFASHFPGFAILITLFAPLLGYLKSMLFVSILSTIAASISFYFLVKDFKLTSQPLILSLIFLILPARWLIVHSVGSSEPTFIFFIISAIYFFMKFEQNHHFPNLLLASLMGLFTQFTRPPGILLFIALAAYIHWKFYLESKNVNFFKAFTNHLKYFPLLLIPLTLLLIFFWYGQTYHDFLAYFHSGDNIHLTFPPFQVFNKHQFWVGDIWLEDIVYILILGFLAGLTLIKRKLYPMGFFVLTYMIAGSFVIHRDISRYLLPVFPFALIAFEKVLVSREFRIVLIILALAIYLYCQNYIINNVAPVANLSVYN